MSENMKKGLLTFGIVLGALLVYDLSKPMITKLTAPKKA